MKRSWQRWTLGAGLGVLVAACAGLLTLPSFTSSTTTGEVVAMDGYDAGQIQRFRQAAEPGADVVRPQPVPDLPGDSEEERNAWETVQDRADWADAGVVTCDLGALGQDAAVAHLDMDGGVALEGSIDLLSRLFTPVQDGRITFVALEPEGEARVRLSRPPGMDEDTDPAGPASPAFANRALRVRWTGAEPGRTVGCTAAWEPPAGRIAVTFDYPESWPPPTSPDIQSMNAFAVVRGCGVYLPEFAGPIEFAAEAGTCILQVESRGAMPISRARGTPITVQVRPGETTRVTLEVPPPPPVWQPPDLLELNAMADLAAYAGADAAADALEELIERVASGEWDAEALEDLARQLSSRRLAERGERLDEEDLPRLSAEDMDVPLEFQEEDLTPEMREALEQAMAD